MVLLALLRFYSIAKYRIRLDAKTIYGEPDEEIERMKITPCPECNYLVEISNEKEPQWVHCDNCNTKLAWSVRRDYWSSMLPVYTILGSVWIFIIYLMSIQP